MKQLFTARPNPMSALNLPGKSRDGSALLLTLMVVSLMLVLVLGFVAQVRLNLRQAEQRHQLVQAQANARLGVHMALAALQRTLGPDQRITARGGLFDGEENPVSAPGTVLPASKWRWVGVWDAAVTGDAPITHKPFLGWLMSSGNPGDLLSFDGSAPDPDDPGTIPLFGPARVGTQQAHDILRARRVRWEGHAYAWAVDDHGLKAQLGANFHNDHDTDPYLPGGGLIPGAYNPSQLAGMAEMAAVELDDLSRLNDLQELSFLIPPAPVGSPPVHQEKFYDYTLFSRGVLADTRHGGLKRDLTLAFENPTVFDRVFPETEQDRYLLIDPDKLAQADDLQRNGYIHWNIFRDYYNLKRHITELDGMQTIMAMFFDRTFIEYHNHPLSLGTLPPHGMGPDTMTPHLKKHPFGQRVVRTAFEWNNPSYRHNHIGPILGSFYQTAWLEYRPPVDPTLPDAKGELGLRGQFWSSHYNPYNIGLDCRGVKTDDITTRGIRFHHFPQIFYRFPDATEFDGDFSYLRLNWGERLFDDKRMISSRDNEQPIPPGRSRFYGVERTQEADDFVDITASEFGPDVKQNMDKFIYHDLEIPPLDITSGRDYEVGVTFSMGKASRNLVMSHGSDMEPPGPVAGEPESSYQLETTQALYTPFSWDTHADGYAVKRFITRLTPGEMSPNRIFHTGFYLRTTRESGDAIRPLIDANIRAPWVNPRWDYGLGLSTAAAYSDHNQGELAQSLPQMSTQPNGRGYAFMGNSSSSDGQDGILLFDIPRRDLVSLGQLQHAGAGRFSYEPTYIVGNSYHNPRLPVDDWREENAEDDFSVRHGLVYRSWANGRAGALRDQKIQGTFSLYDASYLVNQALWDRFIFTTLPQVRDDYTPGEPAIDYDAILRGDRSLPNPRFLPYVPEGSDFTAARMGDEGDADGTRGGFFHNAGHLMVDGAFNINSTSVDAWEAFLSGTLDLPVAKSNEQGEITGFQATQGVRFPRVSAPLGDGMSRDDPDENYWTGFRTLSPPEVRELAEAVVRQVKRRGPFLSLSEFVNRALVDGALGHAGALQAALDATVNHDLDSDFERPATHNKVEGDSTQGAGFPGQLLQGDILQALSPLMSPRSDTFTIRAYGAIGPPQDASPHTRVWCEALVQRVPDPVASADMGSNLEELASPSSPFGRQFRILSFRWLTEDEI